MQVDEINMVLDEESVTSNQISGFCEWSKMVATKFVAGDKKTILTNLRRDIASHCPKTDGAIGSTIFDALTVPRLFEFVCPTRHEIFTPSAGSFIPVCDNNVFD